MGRSVVAAVALSMFAGVLVAGSACLFPAAGRRFLGRFGAWFKRVFR